MQRLQTSRNAVEEASNLVGQISSAPEMKWEESLSPDDIIARSQKVIQDAENASR